MLVSSFARLPIWNDQRVHDNLPWYFAVSTNKMPAKYLIARRIPISIDLDDATEEDLWREHERATEHFLDTWQDIRTEKLIITDLPAEKLSLIDLNVELTRRMLRRCNFCSWNCRVDRLEGKKHGVCQLESTSKVSSFFHHRGEELVFRGVNGSGTIFFTSCNMRCSFCQNGDISKDKDRGVNFTPKHLAIAAWLLRMEGSHNINFVGGDPTIHLHTIVEAISYLDQLDPTEKDLRYVTQVKSDYFFGHSINPKHADHHGLFNAPLLWNSNFYMSDETMRILRTLMDIWLPDFKFGNNRCARRLARTPRYFEVVSKNHQLLEKWGEDYVIRHLIMPSHVDCCTKVVLKWIKLHMPRALVNIMDQYHPDCFADPRSPQFDEERYGDIARFPTKYEIVESFRYAKELGLNFEPITYEKNMTGIKV